MTLMTRGRKSDPVVKTAVFAATAVTLLAACGGGSTSGSSTGSGTGQSTAPAPTGTPINIGVIGSLTGSQASSSDQGATVAPAWARYINEQLGGINGHPVKVFVQDDGGDPAKAQMAEHTSSTATRSSLSSSHRTTCSAPSTRTL